MRVKRNANSIVDRRLIQIDAPTEHRTIAGEEDSSAATTRRGTAEDGGAGLPQIVTDPMIADNPCIEVARMSQRGSIFRRNGSLLCLPLGHVVFCPVFSLLHVGAYFEASPVLEAPPQALGDVHSEQYKYNSDAYWTSHASEMT